MTGFRLSWFLKDSNGSRLTELKPEQPAEWKPEVPIPRYQNQYLVRLVELANTARISNMTRAEIIGKSIMKKAEEVRNGTLTSSSNTCSLGQITENHYQSVFEAISLGLKKGLDAPNITNDDITTGYLIYSIILYCPETTMKLYQFFNSLLSTQSPRTIIQATVKTIQAENNEESNKMMINKFYLALDKFYNFQLGKILLATSSLTQVKNMMSKDWPYFSHYSKEIDQCLSGANCQGVRDLVQELGELLDITQHMATSCS